MAEINRVDRQVIENELLVALDDRSKVAILLDAQDLRMLMRCLERCGRGQHARRFLDDMRQLEDAAFGTGAAGRPKRRRKRK